MSFKAHQLFEAGPREDEGREALASGDRVSGIEEAPMRDAEDAYTSSNADGRVGRKAAAAGELVPV